MKNEERIFYTDDTILDFNFINNGIKIFLKENDILNIKATDFVDESSLKGTPPYKFEISLDGEIYVEDEITIDFSNIGEYVVHIKITDSSNPEIWGLRTTSLIVGENSD